LALVDVFMVRYTQSDIRSFNF